MGENAKRGYLPTDRRDILNNKQRQILKRAATDVKQIIELGYPLETTVRFVGDRYQLSTRQRMTITRTVSLDKNISSRLSRELKMIEDRTLHIDGFNTIIALEVAYSESMLFLCMDGAIRDLAGLHGTYRLIAQTDDAIKAMINTLIKQGVKRAVIHLDRPVSNSGRLKQRIYELSENINFDIDVVIEDNVDAKLKEKQLVATGDAVILDECQNWFNLVKQTISDNIGAYPYIVLAEPEKM